MDFLNDIPDNFKDHVYPLLGAIWSLEKDKVVMIFHIIQYVVNGPDVIGWVWVSSDTEEHALEKAQEQGEVLASFHLHQLLDKLEETKFLELSKIGEQMRFIDNG